LITEKGRLNGNFNVLKELLDKGMVTGELVKSFSIGELIDQEKFRSLLFYLGLITIKENIFGNTYEFIIPNLTINLLQWDFIRKAVMENYDLKINIDFLKQQFNNMAFEGKWKRLFEYILDRFYEASSIRDFVFHEEGIKMFLLAYLNVSPLYIVHSEPEMNKGFADIFLQKDYIITDKTKYEYIVELKYVKKEELKKTSLSEIREQAINQLERYAKSKKIREKLIKIIIISTNDKLLLLEEIK
jgi:ribosomal protein S8